MLRKVLVELYERDLAKLKTEIEQFPTEESLWRTADGVSNSAGNLTLHLIGNLKHFFGAVLGKNGYVRDRDSEFTRTAVPRSEMLAEIDETLDVVCSTLAGLTEDDLDAPYPIEVFGRPMTTGYFATHLTTHFNYHLGQINYYRRLLAQAERS